MLVCGLWEVLVQSRLCEVFVGSVCLHSDCVPRGFEEVYRIVLMFLNCCALGFLDRQLVGVSMV